MDVQFWFIKDEGRLWLRYENLTKHVKNGSFAVAHFRGAITLIFFDL